MFLGQFVDIAEFVNLPLPYGGILALAYAIAFVNIAVFLAILKCLNYVMHN